MLGVNTAAFLALLSLTFAAVPLVSGGGALMEHGGAVFFVVPYTMEKPYAFFPLSFPLAGRAVPISARSCPLCRCQLSTRGCCSLRWELRSSFGAGRLPGCSAEPRWLQLCSFVGELGLGWRQRGDAPCQDITRVRIFLLWCPGLGAFKEPSPLCSALLLETYSLLVAQNIQVHQDNGCS